jgi:hypothetical protein
MPRTTRTGTLPGGARFCLEEPEQWNGVLLLYSMPIPVGPDDPPWPADDRMMSALTDQGYAVAGSANRIFWPLESVYANVPDLLETFATEVGTPDRTIGFGLSIGGIVTAGLVQRFPEQLTAALPMCGNLAGAVGVHNRELDISFVIKTLLARDSALQLVDISDWDANVTLAEAVVAEARTTPAGRARLALAAAIGNIPGWHDPTSPEPDPGDAEARLDNQVKWYEEPGLLVYYGVRAQVERQAGGNPSWNSGVDYAALLAASINTDQVDALYEGAGLSLDDDLAVLAAEPRIEADADAVAYLEGHIVFDGELHGIPVLTLHTDGDGLVTPDNEHAYADVVGWGGSADLLRQVYVHRAGHCTFTLAEILTALDVLAERLDSGSWPALDPDTLNTAASTLPEQFQHLREGQPSRPGFFSFAPPPFPRPYDIRHTAGRHPAGRV